MNDDADSDREPTSPPTPEILIRQLRLTHPIVGLYEAPDAGLFEPVVRAPAGRCVFAFYAEWAAGRTLHLDAQAFGCPGAGHALLGVGALPLPDLVRYLVDVEGVKECREAMMEDLVGERPHRPAFPHVLIGPLRDGQWKYLRSVTFFVTADQLGSLVMAAHYHRAAPGVAPVIVPSGSACRKLQPFDSIDVPQAAIGATDIGVRLFLPPRSARAHRHAPDVLAAVFAPSGELPLQSRPRQAARGARRDAAPSRPRIGPNARAGSTSSCTCVPALRPHTMPAGPGRARRRWRPRGPTRADAARIERDVERGWRAVWTRSSSGRPRSTGWRLPSSSMS